MMICKKSFCKRVVSMFVAIVMFVALTPKLDFGIKVHAADFTGKVAIDETWKMSISSFLGETPTNLNDQFAVVILQQPQTTDGKKGKLLLVEGSAEDYVSSFMIGGNENLCFSASQAGVYTFTVYLYKDLGDTDWKTVTAEITVGTKYTTTFDSNGGSSVSDITDIASGAKITAPIAPTKDGYAFGGWYKDDDTFADDWDFANDTVTANTTLHAKWIDNTAPTAVSFKRADSSPTKATSVSYTVTFSEDVTGVDTNDFTLSASGVSYTSCPVTGSGKTYTVTVNGVSGNGTLIISLKSSGTGIKDLAGNDINGGYTGETYTIDTTAPLITGVVNNQTYTSEVTPACSENGVTVSLLKNSSTVSGYNLEKISTNGDYSLSVTDSVGNVATVNFTVDIPETYTVSFDTDGGSTNPGNQNITEEGYATAPTDPTKTGYDFLGWYNGSTKWNFATDKVTSNLTLTAKWKIQQFTVSFNADGGSTAPTSQTIDYNNCATAPTDPTKTGYDFLGWYNGSTKWNFATDKVTSNVALTAHWKIQQFTVSFNTDGGSTAPTNQTIDYDNYVTTPTDPTKTGYDFLGWYNGSAKWNFTTDKVTSNVALAAKWKNAQYTVSFNTDGGSTAPTSQTIDYNNYTTAPTDPTKTGYEFLGWYNGSTKWNFATDKVTSNLTLTAHWKIKQFTVTFNTDGGSTAPANQTIDYNNYVMAPIDPTKTNFDFVAWYNGSTKWNFATDKVADNLALIAHWKIQQFTISFNTDGGSTAPTNQTISYNNYATVPSDPMKTGFDFLGWYNGSTKWNFATDKVTSNVALTAHWKIQQFTVTFNTDGGSTAPVNQTIDYNNYVSAPSEPTKTGYDFLGWYNSSTKWNFATDKVTSNTSLTANWKIQKTITIIEAPAEIKNPDLISVAPQGEAFNQPVEVRMKDDPAVQQAITNAIDEKITSEIKDITVFPLDISLYIKGTDTKVQPNAGTSVTITCPIPENLLVSKDKIKVVCLIDGKLTVLDTKIVLIDGVYCAQFTATHFSPYAMVVDTNNVIKNIEVTTNPKTDSNHLIIPMFLAVLSVTTLTVVSKRRKLKVVKKYK